MTTTRSLKINQVAVVLWFNQFTEMDHHTSGANKTKWISTRNLAYLMRRWCFIIFFLVKLIYSLEHTFKVYIYIYIDLLLNFFSPKLTGFYIMQTAISERSCTTGVKSFVAGTAPISQGRMSDSSDAPVSCLFWFTCQRFWGSFNLQF